MVSDPNLGFFLRYSWVGIFVRVLILISFELGILFVWASYIEDLVTEVLFKTCVLGLFVFLASATLQGGIEEEPLLGEARSSSTTWALGISATEVISVKLTLHYFNFGYKARSQFRFIFKGPIIDLLLHIVAEFLFGVLIVTSQRLWRHHCRCRNSESSSIRVFFFATGFEF